MASTTKRHPARIAARMGADAEGRLTALDFQADFNPGAYASWGPTVANRVPVHASGPYVMPAVRAEGRAIYANETPSGAFRGFGVPQAVIATEPLLDELAGRLGIDPLELRHRNAIRAGDRTATGQVIAASAGLAACLDALRPRWQQARAAAEAANRRADGVVRAGVGIAAMWYGIGNTSLSNPSTMRVGIDRKGRVTLYCGAVDIGQGVPYASYAFAAQRAEIEMDPRLGTVKVNRITAAHDVGRAINPIQVEGQIHGGVAQGIGLALMEEYLPGRTENLHDYLIPTIGDVPEIECLLIEDPAPLGPSGAKGIGEPALIPTAPAILNAIHHSTGIRLRRIPATPDRVRAALKAAGYE